MSNPGVIKIGELYFGSHRMWIDDNIGESIHIHIDNLRIDLTINEFEMLCNELRETLTRLISKQYFDAKYMDARFLCDNAEKLLNIESIKIEEVELEKLQVQDDNGISFLKDCARVKSLKGEMDINNTKPRSSNFNMQTNRMRLEECLHFVKEKGYPYESNYIIVSSEKKVILDGWHRAACLYTLYGAIKIPVKVIKFSDGILFTSYYFPTEKVKCNSRVIIYGAGKVGQSYYKQLLQSGYADIVAWVDRDYKKIQSIYDCDISAPNIIEKDTYDYVVIAILDENIKRRVHDWLRKNGVREEKIVE